MGWRHVCSSHGPGSDPGTCPKWTRPRRASVLAEVGLSDPFVLAERLRLVRERDLPRLEHVAAVSGVERHQRVLLDEEDRRALRVDLADDLEDLLDEDRREPH